MADVAVLLIAFKRPEQTAQVLEAVRRAGVRRLFVALDGPRPGRHDDRAGVEAVTALVRRPGWAPEIEFDLAPANLGIFDRVNSAVTWFLDRAGEGIVLEDDCVPHPFFFTFCAELLARYRDDARIMTISGSNFSGAPHRAAPYPHWHSYSYSFTQVQHTWGWATWRRAWRLHDPLMGTWPDARRQGLFDTMFSPPAWRDFWTRKMDGMHAGRRDTWDWAWYYTCMAQRGLCIMPAANLVTNIGDDPGATHTGLHQAAGHPFLRLPAQALDLPLRHPPFMWVDLAYEAQLRRHWQPVWWRRRLNKLRRLLQ